MSHYFAVLALAVLPAAGNMIGSLLAESVRTPKWLLEPIGNMPPAEAEARYFTQLEARPMAA